MENCKKAGKVSVISAGWDPGSDSIVRVLMESLAPKGLTYTNFGPPDFDFVKQIDWTGLGGTHRPLLYLPHWPSEEEIVPIIIN